MSPDKVAVDHVQIRKARSGDYAPFTITIPKHIATKCNLEVGERWRIYTDGKKIILDKDELKI